jgi:hypothetical protein
VHGLEADYEGKIIFTYLDIDDPATESFKESLGYRVQPHIFLLSPDGEVIQQWLGLINREELIAAFESALTQFE